MPALAPLYQTLLSRCAALMAPLVPAASITRLCLLITGIIAAQSASLARIAAEIHTLALTDASQRSSVERRLRRTLNDAALQPATCYIPLLKQLLDWPSLLAGSREVLLAVDDSSKTDQIHLLRISLCYRGASLPLAWAVWPQNVAQAEGFYWQQIDLLFAQVADLLPAGLRVIVTADRAFGVPNFIDRCRARGWHFVLRLLTSGSHRYIDEHGQEHELRAVVQQQLGKPGTSWQASGWLFKDAGWRAVQLAGVWSAGQKECLLVASDLPLSRGLLEDYERRFWIEPGFRNDKSAGWQWESSHVVGVGHQGRLLLGMALASLVVLCVGVAEKQQQLAQESERRAAGCRSKPQPARWSIFREGLQAVRRWLYGTTDEQLPWKLPDLDAPSWQQQWYECQTQWLAAEALCPTG